MVQQTGKQEAAALLEAAKQVSLTLQHTLMLQSFSLSKSHIANALCSGLRQQKSSEHSKWTRGDSGR